MSTIFWDFDGTLAARSGMWSHCLVELLELHAPGHTVQRQTLVPLLQGGFPWHEPEVLHPHLNEPADWWKHLNSVLTRVLCSAGVERGLADAAVPHFAAIYLDPAAWNVYPDARPALETARAAGWRNVIVSNHTPELPELVAALGLEHVIDGVITSARVGAEKPHADIFRAAIAFAGDDDEIWMVGDNPVADVAGPARLGIPGVLIRAPEVTSDYIERINRSWARSGWLDWPHHCAHAAETALDAVEIILKSRLIPPTQRVI